MKKESMEKIESKEEGMGQERKAESKEAEKLPPIFMIYRDNDLFKEWVPKIAETLKGLGRKVEIQSFPAGTEKEEIKKWLKDEKERLKKGDLITDHTVQSTLRYSGISEVTKDQTRINLDDVMEDVAIETLWGDEDKEEYKKMIDPNYRSEFAAENENRRKEIWINIEKAISILVNRILENKENYPDQIVINTRRLGDHEPFVEFGYSIKNGFVIERSTKEMREGDEKAGEVLKEWLIKAGISAENLFLTDEDPKSEDYETKIPRSSKTEKFIRWFIYDRHLGQPAGVIDTPDYKKIILRLPFADFFSDAVSNNLVAFNPEKLQQSEHALEKIVKEKIDRSGKVQEEK